MLQGNLFDIHILESAGFEITADLVINAGHNIFEGHFPGRPLVPGVCMMQMVKEIMELVTGKKTDLIKAHEMKFLAIIDPGQSNTIRATLRYSMEANGNMSVMATLYKDALIHFKFKGLFDFQDQHP